MRRDNIEDKQMAPGEDKDGEAKPGLTVDAAPGQYPPPGSFAATGTVSPNNEDPGWYSADRASWDPSAPPPEGS